MVRLNQAVRPNMGNALFALFLTLFGETILGVLFAVPAMKIVGQEGALFNELFFAAILVFCALLVWLLFQYGFHILVLRMVRKEYVTLGYVFYGFKTIRKTLPLMLTIGMVVAALTVAVVAGGRIFVAKTGLDATIAEQIAPSTTETVPSTEPSSDAAISSDADVLPATDHSDLLNGLLKQTAVLLAVYFLLLAVTFIRFVFVFYLHFDNPADSVFRLFQKSARLMRKNVFRLIRLVICAGGRNLLIAAVAFGATMIIPATGESGSGRGGLSIFVMLLNFVYFVNAYTALLRMYFAFPILYTDLIQPTIEVTITDDENSKVLAETVALLSGDEDAADGE